MGTPSRKLRAVELFAGVGGFAVGLEGRLDPDEPFHPDMGWQWDRTAGDWEVVWANQWEPSTKTQHAADCYAKQFPETPLVEADIHVALNHALLGDLGGLVEHGFEHHTHAGRGDDERWEEAEEKAQGWAERPLPDDFELLVGGFPCQDYSVAKPLSQASGIVGKKGVLWWEIERILRPRKRKDGTVFQPPHVLLENVDRLLSSPSSNRGRDFAIMLTCFAYHGYEVEWRVINAAHYGLPQRRRRVFIYARHLGEDPAELSRRQFEWSAHEALHGGVIARALPCELEPSDNVNLLLDGEGLVEPHEITETWPALSTSPWEHAGYMRNGRVRTARVAAPSDDAPWPVIGPYPLGRMLVAVDDFLHDPALHRFLIPRDELGEPSTLDHEQDVELGITGTWRYLKGAKSVPRGKYSYDEGPVAFPEPLGDAARTVLTGEGGRAPSRFKLAVRQPLPAGTGPGELPQPVQAALVEEDGATFVYRRLVPKELERLNMFEDDWTESVSSNGRRAFCMGNALVVGIVERLGREIARRINAAKAADVVELPTGPDVVLAAESESAAYA